MPYLKKVAVSIEEAKMDELTAILSNFERYGFTEPVVGFVEPDTNFNPNKRLLLFGDGRWVCVQKTDLIEVSLTHAQKKKVFPLYD